MPSHLSTVDQGANVLGCKKKWLTDQLRKGRFPGRKVGRKWMLSDDDLDSIIAICAVKPELPPQGDAAISSLPQATSMTETTARRFRRSVNDERQPSAAVVAGGKAPPDLEGRRR